MPERFAPVAVDQEGVPDRRFDRIAEVAVLAAALVQDVEIVVDVTAVAQPPSLADVEIARVVEAGVGLALPADVVEELGRDVAVAPEVALMRPEDLPAIVVDRLERRVGRLEQRDIV